MPNDGKSRPHEAHQGAMSAQRDLRSPVCPDPSARFVRMDTHVHTCASSGSPLAALGLLGVPECYTTAEEVYEKAQARGMDLVTITDHDTIDGAMSLGERGFESLIVGEEVTTYFPEDHCKVHVLVWALSPAQHEQIHTLGLRRDIYALAHWLEREKLAHALAHPLYDQNARLSVWHIERCALLFKSFETLNGAHEVGHRDALEAFCDSLSPERILELANRHDLDPLWPRSWEKGRTGGSDDHANLNIGRTWTEIDGLTSADPRAFLDGIMCARCRPGGEGGHASRLAHQFAGVGARFASRTYEGKGGARERLVRARLMRFAGVDEREPGRLALAFDGLRRKMARGRRRRNPLVEALCGSIPRVLGAYPELRDCLDPRSWTDGPPFGRHEEMEGFSSDLASAIGDLLRDGTLASVARKDRPEILRHALSYALLEAAQMPYVYSMFQQNKERWLAERLRETLDGHTPIRDRPIRVALFTDTLGDVNGVTRFIRTMGAQAHANGRELHILTSTNMDIPDEAYIHNIRPRFASKMPRYEHLEIVLPPILEVLRAVDRLDPDVIHVSTPGPVGLMGVIAAGMKRIPTVATYHTDFPAYVGDLFDDHVMTRSATATMRLFYRRFSTVLTRSAASIEPLEEIGIESDRLEVLPAGCDTGVFNPSFRDETIWDSLGIPAGIKIVYCGRVSVEKNLPMLARAWPRANKRLAELGIAAHLVVIGDGPYRKTMERELAHTPTAFLGFRHGPELSTLYASGDLFVFPSLTDTLGQAVMEAQASGLPAIVANAGGPRTIVGHGKTGIVVEGNEPKRWAGALVDLASDHSWRTAMSVAGIEAMGGRSNREMFEHFWRVHERAWHEFLEREGLGTHAHAPAAQPRSRVSKPAR